MRRAGPIPPPAGEGDRRAAVVEGPPSQTAVNSSAKLRRLRGDPSVVASRRHLPQWGRISPLLLLAACSGGVPGSNTATPQDLESAAIERGLVVNPDDSDLTGLYARDTDRVCVVRDRDSYRIGAFVDYGEGLSCTGTGTVSRAGEALSVTLTGPKTKNGAGATCSFDARFDGAHIRFPATVPPECAKFCGPRASFAALSVERLSESAAEARALRSAEGKRLCGD